MAAGDAFRIGVATPAQVEMMIAWAQREGWNPGVADARCFRAADPDGFLVGTIDDRLVATISAVRYPGLGFVGLYIVDPEYRGRGYGLRIWTAAMERLEGVVTGLDGVVAQQDNYARSGFVLAHRTIRYGGPARGRTHDDVKALSRRRTRRGGGLRRALLRRAPTGIPRAVACPAGSAGARRAVGGTPVRLRRHPPGA